jgi:Ca2+-binding EF-hand superfamily protein
MIQNQIKVGQVLRSNDDEAIRRVFKQHAEESDDQIDSAYIEKNRVLDALKRVGVEINESDFEIIFSHYDANGDGSIDEEEFRGIVLSQCELPSHDKFREIFNKMCQQEKKTSQESAPCHITLSALSHDNLKDLGLSQNRASMVLEYFEGTLFKLENGKIDFDEFHYAVLSTCVVVDEHKIGITFKEFAVQGKYLFIPKDKIHPALNDIGIVFTEDQMHDLDRTVKLNFNNRLDFHAFKQIVQSPSPVVTWVDSLSIAMLLTDAMPKHKKCDHLRVISTLEPQEIGFIVDEVCSSLKGILTSKIAELKGSFRVMDEEVAKAGHHAGDKYAVEPMKAGDISDFHKGLRCKIGEFLAQMLECEPSPHSFDQDR